MPKKPKEPILVSFETQEYYDKALKIVEAAGVYAAAKKLQDNLDDSATAWKVKGVLTRYYEGNYEQLKSSVHFKRRETREAIDRFNLVAENAKKHLVTKPDSLIDLLIDEERRRKYRNFCEKHRKKNKIVDLQFIEMEYREWKKDFEKKKRKK